MRVTALAGPARGAAAATSPRRSSVADAARAAAAAEKDRIDAARRSRSSARATPRPSAVQAENAALGAPSPLHEQADAALQAESARLAALLQSSGDGPAAGRRHVHPPGRRAPITSGFGYRTDPVTGASAFHGGIDFGASCGTPIKAAGTGTVLTAGSSGGYGNMTLINHGGGMATLYGHQSSIIVSAGQSVTQGQVIGYVGSTGKSTGCHLHFEVRVNGHPDRPGRLPLIGGPPGRSRPAAGGRASFALSESG